LEARQTLQQGSIVLAEVGDARGLRKRRPVLIISSSDDIIQDRPIVGLAITTTFPQPVPASHVEIPWHPRGHPCTGLRRRSAVVCDWPVVFSPHTATVRGFLPTVYLIEVLEKVKQFGIGNEPDAG